MSAEISLEPEIASTPIARVAIIDDVYAGPNIGAVKKELPTFCAAVGAADGLAEELAKVTKCDFTDPLAVTDEALVQLSKSRQNFPGHTDLIDSLFEQFDLRFAEVERIRESIEKRGHLVKTFHSIETLFEGEAFQLVLLDLILAEGRDESEEIARQVYEQFRSFIILMSDFPDAAKLEEEFRRKSQLLRGFFQFCDKTELSNPDRLSIRLDALPRDPAVCHAVHDFVDAIHHALGGNIMESPPAQLDENEPQPAGQPLAEFMHTLRTLGLQDYAILCELTLRDEGHPLGDYMMRMLGCHLIANLLSDKRVLKSVGKLDQLRFTEFLPYGDEATNSFKKLYADSLTEKIVEPWTAHPWQAKAIVTASCQDAPHAGDESNDSGLTSGEPSGGDPEDMGLAHREGQLLKALGYNDDGKDLPFLQLGDLLIRDEKSLVYAVLSAACDLQFTPESVSQQRPRERDDTVLLVPGTLRKMGAPPFPKKRATTGLIRWGTEWYSVDWFDRKLIGLPHCAIRTLYETSGYQHEKRLLMGRALELQHTVLSWVARIGLEVQPPLPVDLPLQQRFRWQPKRHPPRITRGIRLPQPLSYRARNVKSSG